MSRKHKFAEFLTLALLVGLLILFWQIPFSLLRQAAYAT